jgi:hypothetical protein
VVRGRSPSFSSWSSAPLAHCGLERRPRAVLPSATRRR